MSIYKRYAQTKGAVLRLLSVEPPADVDGNRNGEFALLRHLSRDATPADCVVDVGASVGVWTSEALKVFDAQEFICVEPLETNIAALRALASRGNVSIHQLALSDRDESGTIYSVGGGGRVHFRDDRRSKKPVRAETIRYARGDTLLGGRKPYFIKVDCEGHDARVLRGLEETLHTARPIVQFEYCDMWLLAGERLSDTVSYLHRLGYSIFRLWPDRLAPVRFGGFQETYSFQHFIAMPSEAAPQGEITF